MIEKKLRFSWYANLDEMSLVANGFYEVARSWLDREPNATFLITEYGAEALPGFAAVCNRAILASKIVLNFSSRRSFGLNNIR